MKELKVKLAAAIANRCIEQGHAAFFVHVPDLLDHLVNGLRLPHPGVNHRTKPPVVLGQGGLPIDARVRRIRGLGAGRGLSHNYEVSFRWSRGLAADCVNREKVQR